jgi:hypothetical protein
VDLKMGCCIATQADNRLRGFHLLDACVVVHFTVKLNSIRYLF